MAETGCGVSVLCGAPMCRYIGMWSEGNGDILGPGFVRKNWNIRE